MDMGLPKIIIEFKNKAATAINRSAQGVVLVLLNDTTAGVTQTIFPYKSLDEVEKEKWTVVNYDYLKMIFRGKAGAVIAVRTVEKEGSIDVTQTIKLFEMLDFNWMCYPQMQPSDGVVFSSFVDKKRKEGKKIKAVLANTAADSEGIVNFTTTEISVKWEEEENIKEYTTAEYTARITGALAGLSNLLSSTYLVFPEVVDCKLKEDGDAAVNQGELFFIYEDSEFKIGRGVTSFISTTQEKGEDYKKIKIVESMDLIYNDIRSTFAKTYIGKMNNNYDNKQGFVATVNNYLRELQGSLLDENEGNEIVVDIEANRMYLESRGRDTSKMSEQQLKEANTGSYVYLTGTCRPLDAMEDLQLIFNN